MKTALKPDLFFDFRNIGKKNIDVTVEDEEEYENQLNTLSHTSGWVVLKEYIEDLMLELEQVNNKAMESGASFEDIGRNSVVIQLCKEQLQKVIDKVEDVKEAKEKSQ